MAIPEEHESITTNLPPSQLDKVLKALANRSVCEVPGTHSGFAEERCWEVDLDEARYSIDEMTELVCMVNLVSGKPTFVRALINELEEELSVVVDARDYDKAKKINRKIEHLRKLL